MLAGVRGIVAGSIVDRGVRPISVVGGFVVAIPSVTVWANASRQACHQSENYHQFFSIEGLSTSMLR